MVDNLTVDISKGGDMSYMFRHVGGTGIAFDDYNFSGVFGCLQETIMTVIEEGVDDDLKKSPPFYCTLPQIECWEDEPDTPLAILVSFGFNEDRDQHLYRSSIDERVAVEFGLNAVSGGYSMSAGQIQRFEKFRDALRELADKIDVELTKVTLEVDSDD
jgi:hypothetical protein